MTVSKIIFLFLLCIASGNSRALDFGNTTQADSAKQDVLIPYRVSTLWGAANSAGELIIPAQYDTAVLLLNACIKFKKGEKWGAINSAGKEIIPFAYKSIEVSQELRLPYLVVDSGGAATTKMGVYTIAGKLIIPSRFDWIKKFGRGPWGILVCGNRQCAVYDSQGKEIIPLGPYGIEPFTNRVSRNWFYKISEGYTNRYVTRKDNIVVDKNGFKDITLNYLSPHLIEIVYSNFDGRTRGVIDTIGNVVVPAGKYDRFETTREQIKQGFIVCVKGGKKGALNLVGEEILEPKWTAVMSFENGIFGVMSGRRRILIDLEGKKLIPWAQSVGGSPSDDVLTVGYTDKYGRYTVGITDKKGVLQNPESRKYVRGSRYVVRKKKKYGLVGEDGKLLTRIKYEHIIDLDSLTFVLSRKQKHAIYNIGSANNNLEIRYENDEAFDENGDNNLLGEKFKHGLRRVMIDGKLGMINRSDELVVLAEFDDLTSAQKCVYAAKQGKYGLISYQGVIIAEPIYDKLWSADGRAAVVKHNGKFGLVGPKGELLPIEYDSVGAFYKGSTVIHNGGFMGAVDTAGHIFVPVAYDTIMRFGELRKFYKVRRAGLWSIFQADGTAVSEDGLDAVEAIGVGEDRFKVEKNGRVGVLDLQGKLIVPIRYENIIKVGALYQVFYEDKTGYINMDGVLFFKDE
jgi:hypothetical protein